MKARIKRKKKSLRFRLFSGLFIFILVLIGGGYILSLPIWKITDVSVSGAQILSAKEIEELSGIPLSENLFFTSFARARNNLKKITTIKDFHIYRIPPGTVLIKIKERKPIAVVVVKDKSAIIDEDGFILNRNPNLTMDISNMTDLPVVSGLGADEPPNAERIEPQTGQLISAIILELSNLLGSRRLKLELGGFQKISFLLDDVVQVKLGRNEAIKEKMTVFKALLPAIRDRWTQVDYVDVRYPDNPVVKYK